EDKKHDEWKFIHSFEEGPASYLIPVDESAEVELRGRQVLTREELREVCDREKTKDAILAALLHRPSPAASAGSWGWVRDFGVGRLLVGIGAVFLVLRYCRHRKA